jgi:CheY-like chemotaxis protein
MKILIIDDELLVRRALRRAFELKGHNVTEAVDGVEGLDLWRASKPDVVFLDVLMPNMGGLQVLKEIGANKKGLVILMSAHSAIHEIGSKDQLGIDLFIEKLFHDIFELVNKVENFK